MENIIKTRDLEALKVILKGRDDELLTGELERRLRDQAMIIAGYPDEKLEDAARKHLNFAIQVCKGGLCTKSTVVLMLQDMFEVSKIGRCEQLFNVVEENTAEFKQSPLAEACQTFILRMCNDLLKRHSRTVQTSFCGRVLFFLSRYLPLGEKSGLNLVGHFNTQNVTHFNETDAQPTDLMSTTIVDEDMETGEIKESKESVIPVDNETYSMFWQLQSFFSNPIMCYDKPHWTTFQKNIGEILTLFSGYKIEKIGEDDDKKTRKSNKETSMVELMDDANSYFAKYLTSPKLLQLQLNDSQFRRYYLLQCIIVFQYLVADVKFKLKTNVLTEEQSRFVLECREKCYKLLKETHPRGSHFTDSVKAIMQREKEWSSWKNKGCADLSQKADKQPMQLYRKRPRTTFDPSVIDIGSIELTKLWSIEPDLMAGCRSEKRKFTPDLTDFLRSPLDEMDPEQQVEDEYKSVNNTVFQWRASRFLISQSSSYMTSVAKEPTIAIAPYLETVMISTAKNMDEFKLEINEREEREARKLVENSMLKRMKEKEGSNSPNPNSLNDTQLNDETLDRLSILLADHGDKLAGALGISVNPDSEEDRKLHDGDFVINLLTRWCSSNNSSVALLRIALLTGELLSEDIMKVLKNCETGTRTGK